jgi:aspartyl-tRNA(Asn)/glutamyl-tRNA(Gln) amidotransferase subunit B
LAPERAWVEAVAGALPALPAARRATLAAAAGVSPADVALAVAENVDGLVAAAVGAGIDARLAITRATNEVAGRGIAAADADGAAFVATLRLEQEGRLTATQAKQVLARVLVGGGDPAAVAAELGFEAMGTDALAATVDAAIDAHPEEWARYREGEDKLAGFFVGKVMAASGGQADGRAVTARLRERRQS